MTEMLERAVTGLGTSGDGIVETATGPVFVPGALPGEMVAFRDGRPYAVPSPSPAIRRLQMLCPHVGRCGGCALQHMPDQVYRDWKQGLLGVALRGLGDDVDIAPMLQAPLASRRRAVLGVRREGDLIELGFHGARSHDIESIVDCAVLTKPIVAGLPGLKAMALHLLTRRTEARISVIDTPHGLDVDFAGPRKDLSIDAHAALVGIASDNRIARLTLDSVPMLTRTTPALKIGGVEVVPPPGAFIQAAAEAETVMVKIACDAVGKAKRVADLFSGLGTFTFGLARRAKILAVDSDRALITALGDAARKAQGLKPIEARVRDLFHDPMSARELDDFDAAVFDPPRAGAKAQAEALAKSKVKTIVAVSCNPVTLARDIQILLDGGYKLGRVSPIDQFLFTAHIEAVAVLRR